MHKILFKEEQQFRQWWYLLTLIGSIVPIMIFCIYALYRQAINGVLVGNNPVPNWLLIILFFVFLGMLWGSLIMKLEVWIDQDGIHYRFFPMIYKYRLINKEQIQRYEIRKYNPIFDYGGWGVRHGLKWGKVRSVSGNIGLQLYLTDGKKVLFGTQRSQAIMYAMDEMMKSKTETKRY